MSTPSKNAPPKSGIKSLFILPQDLRDAFVRDSVIKNRAMCICVLVLICVFGFFNIARLALLPKNILLTPSTLIFLILYIALVISAIAGPIASHALRAYPAYRSKLYQAAFMYWVAWHAVVNALQLRLLGGDSILTYVSSLLAFAVLMQVAPQFSLLVILPSYVLFIVFSWGHLPIALLGGVTITVVVSLFASISRYANSLFSLNQQVKIETVNKQLLQERETLRLSLEKLEIIMHQSSEFFFEWDIVNDKMYLSHALMLKFDCPTELTSTFAWINSKAGIHPDDKQKVLELLQFCRTNKQNGNEEIRIKTLAEQYKWYRTRLALQYDLDGEPIYGIGALTDIDGEKKQIDALSSRVDRDALTNILNTAAFKARVQQYAQNAKPDGKIVLFMIDLDVFKSINDTCGHPFGDYVLVETAKAMRHVFREGDFCGRLGGDEFAAALLDIECEEIIRQKADALIAAISAIDCADKPIKISCSIGIARASYSDMQYDSLYAAADKALYIAKDMGKNCYYIQDR